MIFLLQNKKILKQLFLYGITGFLINLLGFGIYAAITWFGIEPKLAMTFLYASGVLVSFFANKKIVFGFHSSGYSVFVRFVLAHIIGYVVNFLILYYFYDLMGYTHKLVQLVAILVVAFYLFVVFKFLVFKKAAVY